MMSEQYATLMTYETWVEFRKLKEHLQPTSPNIAQVFVPIAGFDKTSPFRILFIGKATYDYAESSLSTFEGAAARDFEIMKTFIHGGRPFWIFIRRVLDTLVKAKRIEGADLCSLMGWSNLAKIGDTKGNPTPASLAVQKNLCVRQMQHEIEVARPDAVVLTVNNYARREIVEPCFGSEGWTTVEAQYPWRWKCCSSGPLIVWTVHPQFKERCAIQNLAEAVGQIIASRLDLTCQ